MAVLPKTQQGVSSTQPSQQPTYGYGLGVKLLHINQDLQKFTSFHKNENKETRGKIPPPQFPFNISSTYLPYDSEKLGLEVGPPF